MKFFSVSVSATPLTTLGKHRKRTQSCRTYLLGGYKHNIYEYISIYLRSRVPGSIQVSFSGYDIEYLLT